MQTADKITIPFEQSDWLSHMAITILVGVIINNLTLPSGYALTPAHDASSYTSHLMWYTPFWSPLGIQDSTDQNQVTNKSSSICD